MHEIFAALIEHGAKLLSPLKNWFFGWFLVGSFVLSALAKEPLFPHMYHVQVMREYLSSYLPLMIKWGSPAISVLFTIMTICLFTYSLLKNKWLWTYYVVRPLLDISLALLFLLSHLYVSLVVLSWPLDQPMTQSLESQGQVLIFALIFSVGFYSLAFSWSTFQSLGEWARRINQG
jgi:hypothetical protein